MTTYVSADDNRKWKPLDDSTDLRKWAEEHLLEQSGLDSDGGYYAYYEFWRDGVRTYAYAEYDGWDRYYGLEGEMNDWCYGTREEVIAHFGGGRSEHMRVNDDPSRDWIMVNRMYGEVKWPPK